MKNSGGFFQKYELPPAASVYSTAANYTRIHCLGDNKIAALPKRWSGFCVSCYHGGKTGYYLDGPRELRNVHHYDIVSAYPHAMTEVPAVLTGYGDWVCGPEVAEHFLESCIGVRVLSYADSPYKCLWNAAFEPAEVGEVAFTTGRELQIIRRLNLARVKVLEAIAWQEQTPPRYPLREFAETMFPLKDKAPDPASRYFIKMLLNGLSGKLIETREKMSRYDPSETYWTAGGLFHPYLAALITGHTRAKILDFEVRYQALHTATDGFGTLTPPDAMPEVSETGGLGTLHYDGVYDALLVRSKTYVYFEPGTRKIAKSATHGFQARMLNNAVKHYRAKVLIELWKHRKTSYVVERLRRAKEAVRRGLPPGELEKKRMTLKTFEKLFKRKKR